MKEEQNYIINFISKNFENKNINNQNLIQIIELCGDYLNLKTISNYSKSNNISYNGAKKCRKVIKIFDVKFIVDND